MPRIIIGEPDENGKRGVMVFPAVVTVEEFVRTGQTEGAVDLSRLAGFKPAGVICEIMRDDGTMARLSDLEEFSIRYGFKIATIASAFCSRDAAR